MILPPVFDGMSEHGRLDAAMFWVGALFVFTPIIIGSSVLGYIWWSRRKRTTPPAANEPG